MCRKWIGFSRFWSRSCALDACEAETNAEIVCAQGCPTAVSLGGHHTCVRDASGGIRCWGRNHQGQLGDGETGYDDGDGTGTPVDVDFGNVTAARIVETGQMYCWGDNEYGQIGSQFGAIETSPVQVFP